ncbi:Epimerase family protein SDR39U1-like, chloroplastic [Porphyridium purpureum]|uniref:Epimerase family protein SDR39U1-like, chloroplastic n=1 Tax=Porphyridium purpureum TaxID=35688 RepID=A0A5J4YME0_PORPP|nr:Epimerase family protein SDR39U1-like, chloroplastic [Porphyridium purpureum]|eukprot:POR1373..scf295_9
MAASTLTTTYAAAFTTLQSAPGIWKRCDNSSGSARFVCSTRSRVTFRKRASAPMMAEAAPYGKMRIAVAGGTGFVGSKLTKRLIEDGNTVVLLARSPAVALGMLPGAEAARFNAGAEPLGKEEQSKLNEVIEGCDAVVNLAGEPIAEGRWTDARKKQLVDSRVNSTLALADAIQAAQNKPAVFVSGSAIGYYGTSETAEFDESAPPGADFLASVCIKWEEAADKVASQVRTVKLRTGIVLGASGGALAKMMPLFTVFLGGPLGSGTQWVSWIHIDDEVGIIVHALQSKSVQGALNGTAPKPVTFSEMCAALGRAMRRPSWLPAPGVALQILLGESSTLVLDGQKVLPKRTLESGYKFKYSTIDEAMTEIVQSI